MSHPNEALIRELFATFVGGDREAAARFFAEDTVFHYPGPGALHGDYRGREGVLRLWAEQDRCSGGEFRPELLDLVAGDRNVFLLARIGSAWHRVVVYEISDGLIAGARVFEDDPVAAAAFFSKATTEP